MPAGGDHDVIGREHPPGRGDAARIDEAARTAQQLHLALREVRGVDLVEAQHVRVASLLQRSPVVPGDLEPEAVVRRIVERAAELGGVPAYFLRHAADVHAGAAEAAGLDERRPGAALGGPLRRGQPPASVPYHHQVEFLAHSPSAAHDPHAPPDGIRGRGSRGRYNGGSFNGGEPHAARAHAQPPAGRATPAAVSRDPPRARRAGGARGTHREPRAHRGARRAHPPDLRDAHRAARGAAASRGAHLVAGESPERGAELRRATQRLQRLPAALVRLPDRPRAERAAVPRLSHHRRSGRRGARPGAAPGDRACDAGLPPHRSRAPGRAQGALQDRDARAHSAAVEVRGERAGRHQRLEPARHGAVRAARAAALEEFAELESFVGHRLAAWDVGFHAERLQRERFSVSQEELRPYFPLPRVLGGLFEVAERLFGVAVRERNGAPVWHPDVRFFEIVGASGEVVGSFYLDAYARPNKRSGAWMDECVGRKRLASGAARPVAYLVCNFLPPGEGRPALLTHDDVLTLFHEFGHGLHHLLTSVDYPSLAGINGVAWDAVELPSQFLENYAWNPQVLQRISGHFESGVPLPANTQERLIATRSFHAGLSMMRQLEFSLFDFRIHTEYSPGRGARVLEILDEVRREVAVVPVPEWNRFPNSFGHIFAGGYAAGYYSYKWAEVLAADAFAAFEERGVFDRPTALRFLDAILSRGGSRDALEAFIEFRGRRPDVTALLRQHGILGRGGIRA